ncbi:transglutaminaseTgpA domain-containing protein [Myceligenerans xiligouense]|uniref:Transglutaminase superfamily protein n=1 Tax=Myceligenerans xiligouense TaxID=253184 RepID=A0A3N4YPE7_9MICO|nr:transglutaminase domain-containing protein [Myceligenerans xiligouense]RPF22929.1 transglutaminase superfamily protein [Myceligenerans xiligouense]
MSHDETTRGGARRGISPDGHRPSGLTGSSTRGGGTTRRADDARPRALKKGAWFDLGALAVMCAMIIIGFGPVWGTPGYLVPAVGGTVLGLFIAWLCAWRRWPAVTVAALAVVGYLVFGASLALPRDAILGFVPSLTTLQDLLLGAIQGWKAFVTTVPPLYSFPDLAVVPYLMMLLVALVAATIALRVRYAAWAMLPIVLGFAGVILLGTLETALPIVQGLVIAVVGLLWGGVRAMGARVGTHSISTEQSREATRRLLWYRVRTGAIILGVAGVAAGFAGPALLPDSPRTVLREEIVPPFDVHEFSTPLASFRHYAKDEKETEILRVTGLPENGRIRLATLDEYDGVVYDVAGEGGATGVFTRVGQEIVTAAQGDPATIEVTSLAYDDVWVPEVGDLSGVTWTGSRAADQGVGTYYNNETGTAVTLARVREGDTYQLDTLLTTHPSEEDLAHARVSEVELPKTARAALPANVSSKVAQYIGEETEPAAKLFLIRDALEAGGILSSGLEGQPPSRPGHAAERIDNLLENDDMIGDEEQFAVAFALLARQTGIPARVVMGFAEDEESERAAGEEWLVRGEDVSAWIEVPFEGYGWVPIDVDPDEDTKIQPEPQTQEVPKPPVLQEPEPPEEPEQNKAGSVEDEERDEADNEGFDWAMFLTILLAVAIPLALVLLPILLILAHKARRRTRRRTAEELADRFSGGWHEVVDAVTDMGTSVPRSATRREGAGLIATKHEAPGTLKLAHRADATVFSGRQPTQAEVDTFWEEVDTFIGGLRSSVGTRQRIAAALSLRSVRARMAGGRGMRGVLQDLVKRGSRENR